MQKHLVLIHGLFHSPWFMRHLNAFYQSHGYHVHLLQYQTTRESMDCHMDRLARLTSKIPSGAHTDFVGHSMGGLIIRQYAHIAPHCFTGRAVTLGTPHQGSRCAAWAAKFTPWIIGKGYEAALNGHLPQWNNACEIGSLAGNKKYEIGTLVLPNVPHDGLVLESETQLEHAKDHITIPIHHNGMRNDKTTMIQSLYFLQNGRFSRP